MEGNNRGYMRYNVYMNPISCSKCDRQDVSVDISDISCSGIGISTNERLIKGENIELEITIPEDGIPMFITGEVAWVTKDPDADNVYNAGVRLTNINLCDKDRLIKYIDLSFVRIR
ncbi:PilZ domain-containing protein [Candidatus Omnitrophota bacterium]